jgi:hypothetical protein
VRSAKDLVVDLAVEHFPQELRDDVHDSHCRA